MAERRLLCLLGPCRVNGVAGYDGDLRGLDGIDTVRLRRDCRTLDRGARLIFFSLSNNNAGDEMK